MRNVKIVFPALSLVSALIVGCSSGEPQLAGSCRAEQLSDKSNICVDYYDGSNVSQWRATCRGVMRGQWSETACLTENSYGGCRAGNNIIWLFPSQKHATQQSASESCTDNGREFISLTQN